jgi:hypothetical protein
MASTACNATKFTVAFFVLFYVTVCAAQIKILKYYVCLVFYADILETRSTGQNLFAYFPYISSHKVSVVLFNCMVNSVPWYPWLHRLPLLFNGSKLWDPLLHKYGWLQLSQEWSGYHGYQTYPSIVWSLQVQVLHLPQKFDRPLSFRVVEAMGLKIMAWRSASVTWPC